MDKKFVLPLSIFFGLASSLMPILNFNSKNDISKSNVVNSTVAAYYEVKSDALANEVAEDVNLFNAEDSDKPKNQLEVSASENVEIIKTPDPVIASAVQPAPVSRGNAAPNIEKPENQDTKTSTVKKESSSNKGTSSNSSSVSKTETLDWKTANKVFSIGSVVEVTDTYTKKTFKIKRTMGGNHADCEALTKEDAQIIKSIWGGFSWDVRPIIINVKGRKLAASMSSLPHAGVDSAPAYAVVDNRSEGYGTGENLDTIKGNGMDGHFDVHFLNSTRHKDGKVDPNHQKAIKIAGSK
jgi:hypothetical protein